jgi:hypothetical protein
MTGFQTQSPKGFLRGLFGPRYKPSPMDLEGVVGTWTAANTRGGLALAGGQVVLTPTHLVFSPWDMDRTRAWLAKGLKIAGVPYVGQVDKLITASKLLEPVAISLDQIGGVQQLNRASALRPPTVRLYLGAGGQFDLGILHSPTTWNPSPKNNTAMQDFLSKLGAVAGG